MLSDADRIDRPTGTLRSERTVERGPETRVEGRFDARAEARPEAPSELEPELERAASEAWRQIETVELSKRHLGRTRVVSLGRTDPANTAIDMLRTRLLQALRERGWSRVGITSPTKGCGKTFVSTNLAISLARQARCRTLLIDLDLRVPSVAKVLGTKLRRPIETLLRGEVAPEAFLVRPAPNLAVALNTQRMRDSAEFLQNPETAAAIARLRARYRPDVVIYDLPPMLACDDVVGFLPQIDGLLLVAGGGMTRADEVSRCERLIENHGPLLGVVLNRAEDPAMERYTYG